METKRDKWVEAGNGWIETEAGDYVVEYAGCGSHKANWRSDAHKEIAIAAPELLDALRDLFIYVTEGLGDHDADEVVKAKAALAGVTSASLSLIEELRDALAAPADGDGAVACGKCGVLQPLQHSPDCGRPTADEEKLAMAKYIVRRDERSPMVDFACAECAPHSDMLSPGFRCAVHTAWKILGDTRNVTPVAVSAMAGLLRTWMNNAKACESDGSWEAAAAWRACAAALEAALRQEK